MNISNLIDKGLEGYHITIFAFGQTGSGKTFTMDGFHYSSHEKNTGKFIIDSTVKQNWGIIPRSITYLFDIVNTISNMKTRKYTISCSYLQIYNERIYDLLNSAPIDPISPGLKLRYKEGNFTVENLYTFECKSFRDFYNLFTQGLKNRAVASHRLNHASSRSHSILTLTLESINLENSVVSLKF